MSKPTQNGWTPIQTLARSTVESMHSRGLMKIEVGPGGNKRQQAYEIVERALTTLANELGYVRGIDAETNDVPDLAGAPPEVREQMRQAIADRIDRESGVIKK